MRSTRSRKRSFCSPQAPLVSSPLSARMPAVQARVAVSYNCPPCMLFVIHRVDCSALLLYAAVRHQGVCLQIRFTRRGRKQLPFYRVIAIDHREKRDGRPLEARFGAAQPAARLEGSLRGHLDRIDAHSGMRMRVQELGWYDPLRKETNLNAPAIKKWLSVGAQPSETVEKLLKKAMIMDP